MGAKRDYDSAWPAPWKTPDGRKHLNGENDNKRKPFHAEPIGQNVFYNVSVFCVKQFLGACDRFPALPYRGRV